MEYFVDGIPALPCINSDYSKQDCWVIGQDLFKTGFGTRRIGMFIASAIEKAANDPNYCFAGLGKCSCFEIEADDNLEPLEPRG